MIEFAALDTSDQDQAVNGIGGGKSHYHQNHHLRLEGDSYSTNVNNRTDHSAAFNPVLLLLNSRTTLILTSARNGPN